jgi:hypothetical protein
MSVLRVLRTVKVCLSVAKLCWNSPSTQSFQTCTVFSLITIGRTPADSQLLTKMMTWGSSYLGSAGSTRLSGSALPFGGGTTSSYCCDRITVFTPLPLATFACCSGEQQAAASQQSLQKAGSLQAAVLCKAGCQPGSKHQ